jgi:hypothetical protein
MGKVLDMTNYKQDAFLFIKEKRPNVEVYCQTLFNKVNTS